MLAQRATGQGLQLMPFKLQRIFQLQTQTEGDFPAAAACQSALFLLQQLKTFRQLSMVADRIQTRKLRTEHYTIFVIF